MTVQSKIIAADTLVVCKGRDKAAREVAFTSISVLSFIDTGAADTTFNALRKALGKSPTSDELRVAQQEWMVGRVCQRLTMKADQIDHVRELWLLHAPALKDGVKAPTLAKRFKGRRTPEQEKAFNAAREAWSQVKARLGLGNAVAGATRKKAERASAKNGAKVPNSTLAGNKVDTKTAANNLQLAPAPKPTSTSAALEHLMTQASVLNAYANKYAGVIPSTTAIALKSLRDTVAKDIEANKAVEASLAKVK